MFPMSTSISETIMYQVVDTFYLGLGEHIDKPATHCAICTTGDEIVRILGPYHLHGIDRMCVSGS